LQEDGQDGGSEALSRVVTLAVPAGAASLP